MSKIPNYLKDNPDYYIGWWEQKEVSNKKETTRCDIDNILKLFQGLNVEACKISPWYPWFKLRKKWQDIWYISYIIDWDKMKTVYVKINDGNNKYKTFNNETNYQWKWYWKKLLLGVAIEAKKMWLTLVTDHYNDVKEKAKYVLNSLLSKWIVELKEDRYQFINSKLP